MKSNIDWVRRGQRMIRMVSELHRMGYQRMRIMPYAHSLAWRAAVAPADGFSRQNGAVLPLQSSWDGIPIYSAAGAGNTYFDWTDAQGDSARDLAKKFVARFPQVIKRGLGRDWAYAGWLLELIGFLEGGDWLPVTQWDDMQDAPERLTFLPIWGADGNNVVWNGIKSIPAPHLHQFPSPPLESNVLSGRGAPAIKEAGGILVRVLEAINGFRTKYGIWPTCVEMGAETLSVLAFHHLTPFGLYLLQSKIEVSVGREGTIVAKDNEKTFDYGSEGWQTGNSHRHNASDWLGFTRPT